MDQGAFEEGSQSCTFRWTINHLKAKLTARGESISGLNSDAFLLKDDNGGKVNLRLCLDKVGDSRDEFRFTLILTSITSEKVGVWWRVNLQSEDHELKLNMERNSSRRFIPRLESEQCTAISKLKDCEVYEVILYIEVIWPRNSHDENFQIGEAKAAELLHDEKYADIKLVCQGKHFNCHKAVLAAASTVFDRMFSQESSQEMMNGVVIIEDMSKDELGAFLKYVYTGQFDDTITTHTRALLAAGDKYDVQSLVTKTEELLVSYIMSPASALEMLLFADKHNANVLRKKTLQKVIVNFDKISKQKRWEKLKAAKSSVVSWIEAFVEIYNVHQK